MYDMQTLHAGGIPMFRGTYLVSPITAQGKSEFEHRLRKGHYLTTHFISVHIHLPLARNDSDFP